MPFVELPESQISLFYRTSFGTVEQYDPSKPVVVLLHGTFMSSEFLQPQLECHPLRETANLIAFDQLSCGATKNRVSPQRDASVDAAALFLALGRLGLKTPFHLFAAQQYSVTVAIRMALLWPKMVASICCAGAFSLHEDLEWRLDVVRTWGFSTDIETLEEVMVALLHYAFGESQILVNSRERDNAVAYWETRYPPFRRSCAIDLGLALLNSPLSNEDVAAVSQPVLILHGDSAAVHDKDSATEFRDALSGANGGARLEFIPGGPENIQYPQYFADLINPIYAEFLSSVLSRPMSPLHIDMQNLSVSEEVGWPLSYLEVALERFPRPVGTTGDLLREPTSAWSFSRVPESKIKENMQLIKEFQNDEEEAFSPLKEDGTPIRKFSERNFERLFEPVWVAQKRRPSIDLFKHVEVESRMD